MHPWWLVAPSLAAAVSVTLAALPGPVVPVADGCAVAGGGSCQFACVAGRATWAIGHGLPGARYRMACGGSVWTCTPDIYVCSTNSLAPAHDDARGVCEATGPATALACKPGLP